MSSFSRALLPAGSGPELAAAVTAEALGSALFQLVAGAARADASGNSAALTGAPSLAPFAIMAAGYAALSSALRPASGGHLNPALSLAAVLGGRLAAASFLAYAAAQLGGGVVGSMLSSLTVPGARLFRRAGAVGCLAHPASAAAAGGGGGAWLGGSNLWRLAAWEGVSSAAASLALLSHASPAFVALAFASVGAAAAAAAPALGDVVGNPVLVLSPAVAFGCGWGAGPARWAGQALGAAAAAHDQLLGAWVQGDEVGAVDRGAHAGVGESESGAHESPSLSINPRPTLSAPPETRPSRRRAPTPARATRARPRAGARSARRRAHPRPARPRPGTRPRPATRTARGDRPAGA